MAKTGLRWGLVFFHLIPHLWRDMRTQKLRVVLTLFGIVWGTVAVSLLLAFGTGLHEKINKDMRGLGDGIVIGWAMQTSMPFEGMGRGRQIHVNEDDIRLLRSRVQGLGGISSEYHATLKLRYQDKTLSTQAVGVSPVFAEMRSLVPEMGGRFINAIDESKRRRVAFFGDKIAREVFGDESPVGKTVTLGESPFLVVGVLKEKEQDSNYNGRDENHVFVPGTTLTSLTGMKNVSNFVFQAAHVMDTKWVKDQVLGLMANRYRFDPRDDQALRFWDTTEMFQFMDTFMLAFKLFLGIVGSLTLVVGGIGVSNIMNIAVEERTREIGIKMAIGARRGWIMGHFLFESLAMTGIGGVLGLLLAAGICTLIPQAGLHEYVGIPEISPKLAMLTAGILGAIGTLAGFFPARDAANLDPVVAMKTV